MQIVSPPTSAQIDAEIEALRGVKPRVRKFSVFRDDNHQAIDVQLKVLAARMNDQAVQDAFGDTNAADFDQYMLDAAQNAREWMEGELIDPPSRDWETCFTS